MKRNKGAAGVDGREIAETETFLREHWPAIRKQLLWGRSALSVLLAIGGLLYLFWLYAFIIYADT